MIQSLLTLVLVVLALDRTVLAAPANNSAEEASAKVLTHHIVVAIKPEEHRLLVTDTIKVVLHRATEELVFTLNPALQIQSIALKDDGHPLDFHISRASSEPGSSQLVTVRLGLTTAINDTISLVWRYEGIIDEAPREPRHLRFVTPSETAGHIGPEGVYLSGETHWYPDMSRSLARFAITITLPEGWTSVTHGRRLQSRGAEGRSTEHWEVSENTESLTLVANRFVSKVRRWGEVEVQTYLFPEEAGLAEEYLNATVQYLQVYEKLLGPYPFRKFAVVENFFASGLGMPSFTLLGSSVIKRHYTQPYALGHEIVHSWIGNWVLNDPDAGNWVEGLTTYLANYYFDELSGRLDEARQQRRMMLFGYAVYVTPETDYPIQQFQRKSDQRDNAIGYQKAAMVIHMLRREIGEQSFWRGIRRLIAEQGGRHTTWRDLERIFSEVAGQPLRWFFTQWIERPGAPSLLLTDVRGQPATDTVGHVSGRLIQREPYYRMRVPIVAELESEPVLKMGARTEIQMEPAETAFKMTVDGPPTRVRLDPDYEVFRRLDRQALPPMLNLFVTDPQRTVVLPEMKGPETRPYEDLVERLHAQNMMQQTPLTVTREGAADISEGSILVLGDPAQNRSAEWVARVCGDELQVGPKGFTVGGQTYHGQDLALLISCRHPRKADRTVTLFYGMTAPAAAKVARLLFFYGWQSYLVFRDGTVIARGDIAGGADAGANVGAQ